MANGNRARTGRTSARTLFLSDIHLGFRHARVRELNEFLHGVEAERIVLVGDIVDALSLARRAFWTAQHTQVVRTLLARQRAGARLIYIPGNHDASLAMLAQMLQGQFEVHREWVHRTAHGRAAAGAAWRPVRRRAAVPALGSPAWAIVLHDATVMVSHRVNNLRRALGKPYWPLAERMKLRIGASVRYIEQFERLAAHPRARRVTTASSAGTFTAPNLCHIEGTLYGNTGDWVESCSALVETQQGELQLLRWPHAARPRLRPAEPLVADAA